MYSIQSQQKAMHLNKNYVTAVVANGRRAFQGFPNALEW